MNPISPVTKTQLYLKIEFEHDDARDGQKLILEIAKAVKRIYGVRLVEVQNTISEDLGGKAD